MVKANLYRQNHTKKHTHTHSQKEKKEKNTHIFWEVWGLLPAFSRCSVGVVPHVDVFLMYLWGGRWSPCLTPLPSWRSLAAVRSPALDRRGHPLVPRASEGGWKRCPRGWDRLSVRRGEGPKWGAEADMAAPATDATDSPKPEVS